MMTSAVEKERSAEFWAEAKASAEIGALDVAIDKYLAGLALSPADVEAHRALYAIALRQRALGRKPPVPSALAATFNNPGPDDRENLLVAQRLLCHEPTNADAMVLLLRSAARLALSDVVLWIGPILLRANAELAAPDPARFIALKDAYQSQHKWKLAIEALHYARRLRPDDGDLKSEQRRLEAEAAIAEGNQESSRSADENLRAVGPPAGSSAAPAATPDEVAKAQEAFDRHPDARTLLKLIDALEAAATPDLQERAVELLESLYAQTGDISHRIRAEKIRFAQARRKIPSWRDDVASRARWIDQLEAEIAAHRSWLLERPGDEQIQLELAARTMALGGMQRQEKPDLSI